ncbi:MAG: PH domain-containing protein [Anaerolineae bacterium]|nr:PH domain-containing protein [Thermoflexus sp.]MDW8064704.1 PH domain-containing protein [Anaerolineae bacterium]
MGYIEQLLGANERILFQTRQHPLVLLRPMLGYGILAGALIGLTIASGVLFPPFTLPLMTAGMALAMIPLMLLLRSLLRWWNEVYMVTTRRVVQVEGILNKSVFDSSLEKVNDVVLRQSFWGRLFNYGDIEILTGSEIGVNRLNRIANPLRFKQVMLDQKARLEERPGLESPREGDVESLLAQLEALRRSGLLSDREFEEKRQALLKRRES